MPQSTRGLWPPGLLRHPPIDTFEQVTELRRRDRHHLVRRGRPDEAPTFQALGKQAHALAVMPEHLDQPAASPAEYEQMPAVWITLGRAKPSKPLRMSVWPAASQTRAPLGAGAVRPSPVPSTAPRTSIPRPSRRSGSDHRRQTQPRWRQDLQADPLQSAPAILTRRAVTLPVVVPPSQH
jgi:hypothetical protein